MTVKNRGADRVPADTHSQPNSNTDRTGWQLLNLRHARSLGIGIKLLRFSDTHRIGHEMIGCSRQILTGDTDDGGEVIEAVFHCHRSLCQVCRGERQANWQRKIESLIARDMEYLIDGNKNRYSEAQITRWEQRVERIEHRIGTSRDKYVQESLLKEAFKAYQKSGQARIANRLRLMPYLITITIQNPDHIWTGYKNFSLIHEKGRPDPLENLAGELWATEQEIDDQKDRVKSLYRRRGAKEARQTLRDLIAKKHRLDREITETENPNQLERLLWVPWRKAREYAREHPESKWGRTWSHISGGVWVTEVTFNRAKKTFHPHIHMLALADVGYLANQKQGGTSHWQECLQDFFPVSMNVDIRRISDAQWQENPAEVVREVTKYLTKPEKDPNGKTIRQPAIPDWAYREMIKAQAGRRLINTFGTWRSPDPEWDPNAGEAPAVPSTDGMHRLHVWDRNERRYVVKAEWPATENFPILGAAERLARWGDETHRLIQIAIAHAVPKIVDIGRGMIYAADGLKQWEPEEIHQSKRRLLILASVSAAESAGYSDREIDEALKRKKKLS